MLRTALLDFVQRTKIDSYARRFSALRLADRSRVRAYQGERLARLVHFAYRNVPYYWNLMRERNLAPERIRSVDDLPLLPILERETVRREARNLLAANIPADRLRSSSTSGTTGSPVLFAHDTDGYSAGLAAEYFLRGLSGWKPGSFHVRLGGDPAIRGRWDRRSSRDKDFLLRQVYFPAPVSEDAAALGDLADKLAALNPDSLEGPPWLLYALARNIQRRGVIFHKLARVFTTGEILDSLEKRDIEIALAPVADMYGCGEAFGIATRPLYEDRYYVCDPHVILESEESRISGMKDLLVTNLDNRGLPLIRYRVGDLVDDLREPDKNSRVPFTWFRRIMGRNSDIIHLPNGLSLHPLQAFGGNLFEQYPAISRHRVVWDGKILTFQFEAPAGFPRVELERQLAAWIKAYGASYSIVFAPALGPSAAGQPGIFEIVNREARRPA